MAYKILLIEPDRGLADGASESLIAAGFEVVLADSHEGSIVALQGDRPDLAMVDAALPAGTTLEICQELKSASGGSIPVIVLTDSNSNSLGEFADANGLGCDEYVQRSIGGDELVAICNRLLEAVEALSLGDVDFDSELEGFGSDLEVSAPVADELLLSTEQAEPAEETETTNGDLLSFRSADAQDDDPSEDDLASGDSVSNSLRESLEAFEEEENRFAVIESGTSPQPADATGGLDMDTILEQLENSEPEPQPALLEPTAATPEGPGVDPFGQAHEIGNHIDHLFGADPGTPVAEIEGPTLATQSVGVPELLGIDDDLVIWDDASPSASKGARPSMPTGNSARPSGHPSLTGQKSVEPAAARHDADQWGPSAVPVGIGAQDGSRPYGAPADALAPSAESLPGATPFTPVEIGDDQVEFAVDGMDEPGPSAGLGWKIAAAAVLIVGAGVAAIWFLPGEPLPTPEQAARLRPAAPSVAVPIEVVDPRSLEVFQLGAADSVVLDAMVGDSASLANMVELMAAGEAAEPTETTRLAPAVTKPSTQTATPAPSELKVTATPQRTITVTQNRAPAVRAPADTKPSPKPQSETRNSRTNDIPKDRPVIGRPAPQRQADTEPPAPAAIQPNLTTQESRSTTPNPDEAVPAPARYAALADRLSVEPGDPRVEDSRVVYREDREVSIALQPIPGSDFVPPKLLTRPDPEFPATLVQQSSGSTIVLRVRIDEQGQVVRIVVEEGERDGRLTAKAISAVLRSRYSPATIGDGQVKAWVLETFTF